MQRPFTLNWGHKLIVVFLAFGLLMGYLAYRSFHTRVDLVNKEYYKDELRYQEIIDGTTLANSLSGPVEVSKKDQQILVRLPQEMSGKTVTGTIWFYCAADAARDRHLELRPGRDGTQAIDTNLFRQGTYVVKIRWSCDDKQYYTEKNFSL